VERCCALAQRAADRFRSAGYPIRNDVVLNQVLVSLEADGERTDRIIDAVQREGTCWLGATTWRGERLLRFSVSNHSTTADDIDRSVDAVVAAVKRR